MLLSVLLVFVGYLALHVALVIVQALTGMDLSRWTDRYVYFVFYSSLLVNVLAVIEKWAHDWYPGSGFAKAFSAITDLVSRFAALNWREKLAGKGSVDRRNGRAGEPMPPTPPDKGDAAAGGK